MSSPIYPLSKRLLTAALVLACVLSGLRLGTPSAVAAESPATLDTLVSAQWLAEHLDDPDLVVLDCTVMIEEREDGSFRPVSGKANHDAGHIPGAGFADLMGELSDSGSTLGFALPAPEEFASAMARLGVGEDTRVVLYDASGSAWAARVWWMLRWIGFDRAALLDGGLQAWTASGQPLSTKPASRQARSLAPKLRPGLIAQRDEVLAAIDDHSVHLIDALPADHYRGEEAMYARPGHIPSATNVPMFALLDESGRFRPLDELASLFALEHDDRAITYCGGGIAASANAFVMTRLGFTDVAVYAASLQEWAADPSNPMETGE